jgi:hypothetical protein
MDVKAGCLEKQTLWTWRRLFTIPWSSRMMKSVINQIKPKHSTETLATISKLNYSRHIMQTSNSLEKDLVLGLTDGSK